MDGKLGLNKFSINIHDNEIIINSLYNEYSIIKIPIYNKYNGIDYFPICFPLKMIIINDYVFNPYIILSSYNFNIDNNIDFFYNINKILNDNYNLKLMDFNNIDIHKIINLINTNYINTYNLDNLQNVSDINKFTNNLWFNINIIKLLVIIILVNVPYILNTNIKEISQKYNYPKKILTLSNEIKIFKYILTNNNSDNYMNFIEYCTYDFKKPLNISHIKKNNYYYIIINKNEKNISEQITEPNLVVNKIIKVFVHDINNNIISISKLKNILFENYKWYFYHPTNNINKEYVIYQTFINNDFTGNIIKNILNIELVHCNKIIEYYYIDNKKSSLLILSKLFKELEESFDDITILKSNSYSNVFFEYITKKYSITNKLLNINDIQKNQKIYDILSILFEKYNYPLNINRRDLDNTFDQILYFSLYNYKQILIPLKNNGYSNFTNDILNPIVNNIIPIKIKKLYINILKTLTQIINNDFESITYNQKFYYDYLHKNIIKIFFSNSNKLSIILFKSLITPNTFAKFKKIVSTNLLLIDIANKLSWNTLPKKLNYLNLFYKNNNILYYQDKFNKNIIPDNFDVRIKKIIENPFEMYKYFKKEKDFEKWTKFISDKIMQLYHIPISISTDDLYYIGKLIYLLFNINEQNINDSTYILFINFCNMHNNLILESNRINIKIKECFPTLKTNINLGILAKHLTWDKNSICFDKQIDNNDKTEDILELKIKLHVATNKYYKYKAKYLETKDNDINNSLIIFNQTNKDNSITSSIIPNYKDIN
jgi:hypothetical protein